MNMVAEIARDAETAGLPFSGISGINDMARRGRVHEPRRGHGAGLHGSDDLRLQGSWKSMEIVRLVSVYLAREAMRPFRSLWGVAHAQRPRDWQYLNLNFVTKSRIDQTPSFSAAAALARAGYLAPGISMSGGPSSR